MKIFTLLIVIIANVLLICHAFVGEFVLGNTRLSLPKKTSENNVGAQSGNALPENPEHSSQESDIGQAYAQLAAQVHFMTFYFRDIVRLASFMLVCQLILIIAIGRKELAASRVRSIESDCDKT